jgi:NAD(P)H dehydrogenase (quinone)
LGEALILVTGASGKTGRAIIRALIAKGATVRALVHRPEQVASVQELGAQVVVGDMRDQAAMEETARGAQAIYHICPNMNADEVAIGQTAIAVARAAGVERLVYHSVLHPQTEAMLHHWNKLRVEEKLFESGLAYTILQPSAYMQNVMAYWGQIVKQGIYAVPYSVETRLGMVDLEDVAQAAAIVLTEGLSEKWVQGGQQPAARASVHVGATYELAGPEILSQSEVAETLGRQLGQPVRAQAVALDEWERRAKASRMSDYAIETLTKMFRYYERNGFWGNPNVLAWLLGRSPTTFAAFVERVARRPIPNL